ncbi:MAG: TolC family protein [Planctomycetaceae bacterium]|nr:TolC family protein [Planctomycetaceae bacterium]
MDKREHTRAGRRRVPIVVVAVVAGAASCLLVLAGCFAPTEPYADRDERVMEALSLNDALPPVPSPLTPAAAVEYALQNSLESRVAEIDLAYQNEAIAAAHRRLLPSLTMRYSANNSNHPAARWSQGVDSGQQSLVSSYSADRVARQAEVGAMWSLLDFGVGYLKAKQQGERLFSAEEQVRRVRQKVTLDVLSAYWRASAAMEIAREAEGLRKELEEQAELIRDSVDMRILSGAEGARRELVTHNGLADLEQYRRAAAQALLELARTLGSGSARDITLDAFPAGLDERPPDGDPSALQEEALRRRPELYQQDAQERIALHDARLALVQMAPNASLSLNYYHDPDLFLQWNDWMTVGARVSWNLLNIPARISERRMAKLQGESARMKGLALAAGVMAQVGIAYSDWMLSFDGAQVLENRAAARRRLVEALAEGERDGQTRPGEVLQERVKLLEEWAMAVRAIAESKVAEARLAAAVGLDFDDNGCFAWSGSTAGTAYASRPEAPVVTVRAPAVDEWKGLPPGSRIVPAEEFLAPDSAFIANE